MNKVGMVFALLAAVGMLACGGKKEEPASGGAKKGASKKAPPSFTLAWSEYPSWSAFGVASEFGIIKGKKGELGEIEKKYNVDIVLKEADYDTCITMYGSGQADAAALTNMDSLNPALGRKTVAILPTSTSNGADALITTKSITDVAQLEGKPVYGLAATVSEYMFVRGLEIAGKDPSAYKFTNKDPAAAALAMQQKQSGYDAIAVWNPFVLETLKKRPDTHVLYDSTKIPGEIIDMIVMSQESLDRPGGEAFAKAVVATFYAINKRMADPKTGDDTLVALGEKFSNLKLASMKKVVEQTKFYKTPDEALALFEGAGLKSVMTKVVDFCTKKDIVKKAPTLGYGDKKAAAAAQLRFDASFIKAVKSGN